MQLKLRHFILFFAAALILIIARTSGGALLAMASLFQMALLIHGIDLSKKSQLAALKLFIISIPLFLFWGGIHSFTMIYFKEGQYLFLLMTNFILAILSFIINFQTVFCFLFLKTNNFEISATLQNAFNEIKNRRMLFLKSSLILLFFSLAIPGLESDWTLVFAVMATHVSVNYSQMKKAFVNF